MRIVCSWCGKSLQVPPDDYVFVWPPKELYCCSQTLKGWEKKQRKKRKQKASVCNWVAKLFSSFFKKS